MEKRNLQPLSEECGSSVSFPQEVDTENNCCIEDYHLQSTSYFKSPQKATSLKRPHPIRRNLKTTFIKHESDGEDVDPQGSRLSEVESSEDQSSDVSGIRNYESYIHNFVENATLSKGPPRAISKLIYPPINRRQRDYSKERARKFEKFRLIQPWSTKPSHLEPVPDHLWILPCNSDNTLKGTLYIVSNVDHHRGCRFTLQGKTPEKEYVFACTNCSNRQRKTQYAVVKFHAGEISVDAQSDHVMGCFRLDLRRALNPETGVLTNF